MFKSLDLARQIILSGQKNHYLNIACFKKIAINTEKFRRKVPAPNSIISVLNPVMPVTSVNIFETTQVIVFPEQWIIPKSGRRKNMIWIQMNWKTILVTPTNSPHRSLNRVLLSIQWKFDSVTKRVPGNMVMAAFDMYKENPCRIECTGFYKSNFNYFGFFWPQ